ncbi:MAG: PAS domain-containing sensor histidine kinase [Campylobacterota bacterium]|nr:PAS domain-containing sensor histidine kinase [Campylobacterota bacterium]
MSNFSIKKTSLFGFLVVFIAVAISTVSIFNYISKIEQLNKKNEFYDTLYHNAFEFKYYTERLLTTYNLNDEKILWIDANKKLKKCLSKDISNKKILEFYKVIDDESQIILKKLEHKIFQSKNIMEKSILRRLGESFNSNKNSDYYLIILNLKNSIDYAKQYHEFLIDEIDTLKETQKIEIYQKIKETKKTGLLSFLLIFLVSVLLSYLVFRISTKIEKELLSTKNRLKETLEETTTILNTSMESIMIAKNGKCIDVNDETLRTFGYKNKNEVLGKSTDIFISPESLNIATSKKELDLVEPYEAQCITKQNELFPGLIKAFNFKNNKGETIRVSAIVNLSEIKSKDKMIFQQSKLAALGEMLENIAHQWRQPLSVITTSATGIQMQKEYGILSDEEEMKFLNTIIDSAKHLSVTIDDFRDFFKTNKKKQNFNIPNTINRTIDLLSSKFKNREIQLVQDMDDIEILGFENEFIQAFMNILNNASDAFDESNDENKFIFISVKSQNNNTIINIKDSAGGIPKDIISHIFEGHFTTKGDKDGTGIGLYMTKTIIEKLEGKISAKTEEFEYKNKHYIGASFTITI